MNISLIIPAYNEERYIGPCLEAIAAHRATPEGAAILEVIVVNNASTDRTAAIAAAFPGVRVVNEPDKGLTKARQRGLIEAVGELVAYTDADTRIPEGWAARALASFVRHPGQVCLSGPFRYYDLAPIPKFFAEALWALTAPITYLFTGYMVLGANFVAKRSALLQIGGFDTTIRFFGEDTDIALRLSKAGKVRFDMGFYIMGSGRRLMDEGLVRTMVVYAMNYLWIAIRQKPFTAHYRDIR
jgi:glycosyltransferase involved in cell wall biosynthesis